MKLTKISGTKFFIFLIVFSIFTRLLEFIAGDAILYISPILFLLYILIYWLRAKSFVYGPHFLVITGFAHLILFVLFITSPFVFEEIVLLLRILEGSIISIIIGCFIAILIIGLLLTFKNSDK